METRLEQELEHKRQLFNELTLLLALDRTRLGNSRTFLAAIRTFLALLGVGAGLLKFFKHPAFHTLGIVFIVLSIIQIIVSCARFLHYRRYVERIDSSMQDVRGLIKDLINR